MNRFSGVTVDFYDDKGALIKERFPRLEDVPDIIKTANVKPEPSLPNEAFALVAIDSGQIMRKFACYDPGTTAMSVMYFMENKDKLPEGAIKLAADNLFEACLKHELLPPEGLTKEAVSPSWIKSKVESAVPKVLSTSKKQNPVSSFAHRAYHKAKDLEHKIETAKNPKQLGDAHRLYENRMAARKAALDALDDYTKTSSERLLPPEGLTKISGWGDVARTFGPTVVGGALGAGTGAIAGGEGHRGTGALIGGALGAVAGHVVGGRATKSLINESNLAARAKIRSLGDASVRAADRGNFAEAERHMGGMLRSALNHKPSAPLTKVLAASGAGGAAAGLSGVGARLLPKVQGPGDEYGTNMVDITGQGPGYQVGPGPSSSDDYAVTTENGQNLYPIHDWDHIKQACDFWALESRRMDPEHRRQFAVKVASKAEDLGYFIADPTLLEAGSTRYAPREKIETSLEMRKVAFIGEENKEHREFLDELMEKQASLQPEVFAEVVRRFDVMHGLDRGWDQVILSPWETTYGLQKTAEVVWEDAADRVTDEELINIARNHSGGLVQKYDDNFVQGFEKDPIGVFNSLPLPHKRILARLANDMASRGGSFMSSYNEQDPKDSGR